MNSGSPLWKLPFQKERIVISSIIFRGALAVSLHHEALKHGWGYYNLRKTSMNPKQWMVWKRIFLPNYEDFLYLFFLSMGKISILTNIFQRGWNHQLVNHFSLSSLYTIIVCVFEGRDLFQRSMSFFLWTNLLREPVYFTGTCYPFVRECIQENSPLSWRWLPSREPGRQFFVWEVVESCVPRNRNKFQLFLGKQLFSDWKFASLDDWYGNSTAMLWLDCLQLFRAFV